MSISANAAIGKNDDYPYRQTTQVRFFLSFKRKRLGSAEPADEGIAVS